MARFLDRRRAVELRQLGKSYSQIREELGVSKSALSIWLKDYPLTKEQVRALRDVNEGRIEKFRRTMQLKKETQLLEYYQKAQTTLLPFSKRELFLAGLFLYWGEGAKTVPSHVSISNTDPSVLKFSLYWMIEALGVPKKKIQVLLHLYQDMLIEEECRFWSTNLNIPLSQFARPYIKKSTRSSIDEKGFGHGTCMLRIANAALKQQILMAIKAFGDYSEQYIRKV